MWHVEMESDPAGLATAPMSLIWHSHTQPSSASSATRSIKLACGHTLSLDGIVTVVIGNGDEKQSFRLPHKILASKSNFFASSIEPKKPTEPDSEILLPNDSPNTFGQLFVWMCDLPDEDELVYEDEEEVIRYMEVYVMAEKYQVRDVQNALADTLGFGWVAGIPPNHYAWIIDNVAEASPLYKLATDSLAYYLANCPDPYQGYHEESEDVEFIDEVGCTRTDGGIYTRQLDDLLEIPGVAAKVLWAALKAKGAELPTLAKFACRYHVHKDGKTCKTE